MSRVWKLCIAFYASLLFCVPRAAAQCAPPDGLDGGPCCVQASPHIPRPKFTQQSLGICWRDCQIDQVAQYTATWSALQPGLGSGGVAPCAWYLINVKLSTGSAVRWSGQLQATYSRTWVETAPSGALYHVWRFLLNGDLTASSSAGPIPCPVPPCVPLFGNRARFTGYVDYALLCGTVLYENAWMLTHSCDGIDHQAGFPRGGAFHPNRAYTFVGPAASFVPNPITPVEAGTSAVEALRRWKVPPAGATGPVICAFEEPIASSIITPFNSACLCGVGQSQYSFCDFRLFGTCGTAIHPGANPIFTSMGIGSWTNPNAYPGLEILRWNAGDFIRTDGCTGVTRPEYYFGVTTLRGFPAFSYTSAGISPTPLPLTFVDQCNSMLFPAAATTRNVPFKSDQIYGLNLP